MSEIASGASPMGVNTTRQERQKIKAKRIFILLLPVLTLAVAITFHLVLPNQQMIDLTTPYTVIGIYKGLLIILTVLYTGMNLLSLKFIGLQIRLEHFAPLISVVILILTLWDLFTLKFGLLRLPYFPSPDMVFNAFITNWHLIGVNMLGSIKLCFTGLVIGTVGGFFIGLVIGWSKRWSYWLTPIQKVIGSIPPSAFLPFALVITPTSFWASVLIIFLTVFFPVSVMTATGIAQVKNSYFEVARTLGADRNYLIYRVAVPSALPSIFVGLFMAFCFSFLVLIVAEMAGVKSGIGWYVVWQQNRAQYQNVYAALILISLMCGGLITLLFMLKDKILVWQKGLLKW
jgi:NitT/TauT family transport system permease protein